MLSFDSFISLFPPCLLFFLSTLSIPPTLHLQQPAFRSVSLSLNTPIPLLRLINRKPNPPPRTFQFQFQFPFLRLIPNPPPQLKRESNPMASTLISNPIATSDRARDSSRRKKKKKIQPKQDHLHHQEPAHSHAKWKSEAQQHLYSTKLLHALTQVSVNSAPDSSTAAANSSASSSTPRRGRAVREAADRVLAVAAKGKTRWSRAILTSRLKIKFRQHKRQRSAAASGTGSTRPKKSKFSVHRLKGKGLPAVQKKVRVLGRLVPGCRKQPLPVILDEATDYIAALEMQVRAMSRLTQLLSGSTSGST